MAWRFRKSFSPLPGVRLTLSPSGITTSVGVGPLRVTSGARGTAFTANIPGTGVSFRQSLDASDRPLATIHAGEPTLPPNQTPAIASTRSLADIKSGGSEFLTTPGLADFKRLLKQAHAEHGAVSRELDHWRSQEQVLAAKFAKWENGWLLRRMFKASFEKLRRDADDSTARRAELAEQELLSRLQTQIELPLSVKRSFSRLCDEFALMSRSQRIWDTVGHRTTNRVAERTTAARVVDRKAVKFKLGKCVLIESEWAVPHLENANGGDIYLYPLFVLYFVSADSFALLEHKEISLSGSETRFIEEEFVPSDSKVVGSAWAKANKDGSPDKRFKDNRQFPVAQYGKLVFDSRTGMNEEYMISNSNRTIAFAKAWEDLAATVKTGV